MIFLLLKQYPVSHNRKFHLEKKEVLECGEGADIRWLFVVLQMTPAPHRLVVRVHGLGRCKPRSMTDLSTTGVYPTPGPAGSINPHIDLFIRVLIYYIQPVILIIGLIGNTLSFTVMQRPRYSKGSTWVYLRFMAFCDNTYLLFVGGHRYIGLFVPLQKILGDVFCKEYYYMVFVSGCATTLGMLFMTSDRFIAVWWPLKASSLCTKRRAKITLICLTLFLLLDHG
jgi:hypothetical protein